jgi:hypothetical protein
MTHREFVYACVPGLEADLKGAREALQAVDEVEFQEWAKKFDRLPESVLRELWPRHRPPASK